MKNNKIPDMLTWSNLINIKTSTKSVYNCLEVRIATVNVQSVKNKDLILHQHICDIMELIYVY